MRELIRTWVDIDGMQFLRYEPGNGTSYPLVFIPMPSGSDAGKYLVVLRWPQPKCIFLNHAPVWSYIAEKMGLNGADAEKVADVVRYVLHDLETRST